jgi:hypothetical protein
MKIPPPIIPKEHGAWAVLLVPVAVAASAAGTFPPDLILLTLSMLAVFMSHIPAQNLLGNMPGQPHNREKMRQSRFWAAIYLVAGAVFVAPLLAKGLWLLMAFGVLGAVGFFGNLFLTRRSHKTVGSDLVAVASLTLSAPAAYYVASGSTGRVAVLLWVLNTLFFGCSVLYVHMKIRVAGLQKPELRCVEKLSLGKLNVLYHVAVLSVVGIMALEHYTAQFAFLAFVPMSIHAVYGTLKLSGRVRFRNIGLLLLGQSVLFAFLMGILQ